ncbi:TerB family tellurite resistance protein [Silicimonas algicola]|uniref:Tellurite resistance protein TerB n=1 Tax=Silicimonas algicola TaxID=1826607 RepID=A0A316GAG7_9RHOB|nr:TerB family tellurite resistance protein [Silicimonas algicola]AZQ67943.1 TerB family tellurite resistance protein [Silicimonas algicola]PWK57622.1 tellurite resistance protein TerB [Silicimonas algicola]
MAPSEQQLVDALSTVDLVVADTNKFKIKLGIGEDAYSTLKLTKTLQTLWDIKGAGAAGAAAAASPAVATTFFGGGGILSVLGFGAAATTPVGWIIAAAVGSGAAYYGAMQFFSKYSSSRVDTIPKFINTPIDLLGATIFDMMAGLALKVADFAGEIDEAERIAVVEYFTEEWGISRDYSVKALPLVETQIRQRTLKNMAKSLAEFQMDNPDCNPSAMRKDIRGFLEEIAFADGEFDEREELAIETIERELSAHFATRSQVTRAVSQYTSTVAEVAQSGSAVAAEQAQRAMSKANRLLNSFFRKKGS